MKPFVRIAIVVAVALVVLAAVGAFWIWKTIYPKPLPSQPWEVPTIKIPGGPPVGVIPPEKQEQPEKEEQGQTEREGQPPSPQSPSESR